MKNWLRTSTLTVAGIVGSMSIASAGGFGIFVGTYPSSPVYGAPQVVYSAPQVMYSAPQVVYQPAPVTYSAAPAYTAAPAYAPAPTYAPAYAAPGVDRHRAHMRYRPLRGDFVYRYRGRGTW